MTAAGRARVQVYQPALHMYTAELVQGRSICTTDVAHVVTGICACAVLVDILDRFIVV